MSEEQKIQQVVGMLGCSGSEAKAHLEKVDWDVLKAVESNVVIPAVSGSQHIPEKPIIHDGLTDEVREKLRVARAISDSFTAALRNDLRGTQASAHEVPEQTQECSVPQIE
jgi:hypothetical protein